MWWVLATGAIVVLAFVVKAVLTYRSRTRWIYATLAAFLAGQGDFSATTDEDLRRWFLYMMGVVNQLVVRIGVPESRRDYWYLVPFLETMGVPPHQLKGALRFYFTHANSPCCVLGQRAIEDFLCGNTIAAKFSQVELKTVPIAAKATMTQKLSFLESLIGVPTRYQ